MKQPEISYKPQAASYKPQATCPCGASKTASNQPSLKLRFTYLNEMKVGRHATSNKQPPTVFNFLNLPSATLRQRPIEPFEPLKPLEPM